MRLRPIFVDFITGNHDAFAGRCFATVRTRALDRREAASLLTRIAAARAERNEAASAAALAADMRSITLAALYRLVDAEGWATSPGR